MPLDIDDYNFAAASLQAPIAAAGEKNTILRAVRATASSVAFRLLFVAHHHDPPQGVEGGAQVIVFNAG